MLGSIDCLACCIWNAYVDLGILFFFLLDFYIMVVWPVMEIIQRKTRTCRRWEQIHRLWNSWSCMLIMGVNSSFLYGLHYVPLWTLKLFVFLINDFGTVCLHDIWVLLQLLPVLLHPGCLKRKAACMESIKHVVPWRYLIYITRTCNIDLDIFSFLDICTLLSLSTT